MKIALTGHTGFLGSYLKCVLLDQGLEVVGLGRGSDSNWKFDLSSDTNEFPTNNESNNVDLVIHAAGLAHRVPKTETEKQAFFDVNFEGTKRLLKALKDSGNIPKQFLFVSTIAVYGEPMDSEICVPPYPNKEEIDQLDLTPYGLSKWNAEQVVIEWCRNEGVNALIWRLPLIVGENAPGNLGAMEKAIRKGYYFRIGNSYNRMRFYVNIEDIANDILKLTGDESGFYNMISGQKSYGEFEDEIAAKYNRKIRTIPIWLVKIIARFGDFIPGFPLNSYRLNKLISN